MNTDSRIYHPLSFAMLPQAALTVLGLIIPTMSIHLVDNTASSK